MRNKLLAVIILGIMVAVTFGYTRSWTESTPTDNTVANQIDDYNRYLRVDTAERLENYIGGFNAGDSNAGFYHVLLIENAASLSTPAANKYLLYGLLFGGKCELVGEDEDGDMIQLSYIGKHMIGSGTAPQAFMYNTTSEDTDGGRESTIRAKGRQSGGEGTTLGYIEISHDGASDDQKGRYRIMLNDGDDANAPSKCPIEYASDGAIDVTNSLSVLDEDDLASDSNTHLITEQAVKKYVDDQVNTKDFGAYTNKDDDNATMVIAQAYLANQDGELIVVATVSAALDVIGYIDTDSDPASGGDILGRVKVGTYVSAGDIYSFSFPVASGKYFEVTASGTSAVAIYWYPIGTLVKPTDQD